MGKEFFNVSRFLAMKVYFLGGLADNFYFLLACIPKTFTCFSASGHGCARSRQNKYMMKRVFFKKP